MKARALSSQADRKALYDDMQVIQHDQEPVLNIAHSIVFMPMRKNVTGYTMSPLGTHEFDRVDVK